MAAVSEMTEKERNDTRELFGIVNDLTPEGIQLLIRIGNDIVMMKRFGLEVRNVGSAKN